MLRGAASLPLIVPRDPGHAVEDEGVVVALGRRQGVGSDSMMVPNRPKKGGYWLEVVNKWGTLGH